MKARPDARSRRAGVLRGSRLQTCAAPPQGTGPGGLEERGGARSSFLTHGGHVSAANSADFLDDATHLGITHFPAK